MKTRSLGIAFAALLAIAPVRSGAEAAANANAPAAGQSGHPDSVPRPTLLPKATASTPAPTTESSPRKPRRHARKHVRHYAYWEPFPIYWPSYQRHHFSWRRLNWFAWF